MSQVKNISSIIETGVDVTFESLINNTPSCLKIINKKGELLMMNPQGLKMCEITDYESVLGNVIYQGVEQAYRESYIKYNEFICAGNKGSMIYDLVTPSGRSITLESFGAPFELPSGEIAHIAITNDITQRVREQKLLRKQHDALLEASRLSSLGQLSGTIAHEINNPLSVIMTMSEILKMKIEANKFEPEYFVESLDRISETVSRISKIMKSLKKYSRDGKHDEKELINLSKVIKSTVEISLDRFSRDGVEILMELDETLELSCNEVQIAQVISNLVNNAYFEVQKLESKWIKIILEKGEDKTFLRVIDSGKGISPEIVESMMKPFYTTKPQGQGTGLGLSVSKKIIREHGGEFYYNSESENTEFVLEFD